MVRLGDMKGWVAFDTRTFCDENGDWHTIETLTGADGIVESRHWTEPPGIEAEGFDKAT